ncbi:MAG: hypothetical protein A2133_10520 [Actinobacteria bacterium RBG_16_64_13]|nr:MAG: hypothetical protein A2133_10520 [Actinobacteria bacterium RBG_16_64_13]
MAIVVAAVLILTGVGVWFYLTQEASARHKAEDELLAVAQLKVSHISQWRAERLGDGAPVSSNELVAVDIAYWLTTRDPDDTVRLLAWLRGLKASYGYEDVVLVDPSGNVLLDLDPKQTTAGLDLAVLDALATALTLGRSELTDLHRSPDGAMIHIDLVAPLPKTPGADSPIAAVVFLSDAAEFLYPLIAEWPTHSVTGESLLLRVEGDHILFLNELRHQPNTALTLTIPLTNTEDVGIQVALGRQGALEGVDYRGVDVIAAGEPIPGSTWFLEAKMDRAEAMSGAGLRSALGLILMLVLAAGMSSAVWANWQFRQKRHYRVAYEREAERRELLSRFEHIVKHASDAIMTGTSEGTIVDVNDKALSLYGYTKEEFAELTFPDLVPPERRTLAEERIEETKRRGFYLHESLHLKKDGTVFPVEVSAAFLAVAGAPRLQSIVRDISERKKAEQVMRESEANLRSLFSNMTEGAALHELVRDENGLPRDYRIVDVNPAYERILGIERSRAVGRLATEAYAVPEAPFLDEYARVASLGVPGKFTSLVPSMGRTFEITAVPWGEGGFATIFEDITDRIKAEEEQQQFERRMQQTQRLESLGVMAGGIAHDFNNILMAVLGHADLARTDLPPGSPVRENLEEIVHASRRAADLCRQMLAYSGHGQVSIEPLDLGELASELVQLLRTSIPKKVLLNLDLDRSSPLVNGDRGQLTQVVMNLVLNAAEAIGDSSGVINVSTGVTECTQEYLRTTYLDEGLEEGQYVTLQVSDTGQGMDEDTRSRLFEPFYTTKFTGRGLGLSAVLGIVRRHKGAITVHSELGRGTVVRILLPVWEGGEAGGSRVKEAGDADWEFKGTVLLVDDEESILALGRRMLGRLGFTVLTATDGGQSVDIYRAHHDEIALVLLDLTMPEMDGAETLQELRRIDPGVRVVMSSGYTENDISARFAGHELAGFLQKPYTLDILRRCLRAVLADRLGDSPGSSFAG